MRYLASGTASTGHFAFRNTRSVVLPASAWWSVSRPLVVMTTRSASSSSITASIASTGSPRRSAVCQDQPAPSGSFGAGGICSPTWSSVITTSPSPTISAVRRANFVQRLLDGGLDIEPVITHRLGYQEFEKAFEVMNSGNSGKVVMDW